MAAANCRRLQRPVECTGFLLRISRAFYSNCDNTGFSFCFFSSISRFDLIGEQHSCATHPRLSIHQQNNLYLTHFLTRQHRDSRILCRPSIIRNPTLSYMAKWQQKTMSSHRDNIAVPSPVGSSKAKSLALR